MDTKQKAFDQLCQRGGGTQSNHYANAHEQDRTSHHRLHNFIALCTKRHTQADLLRSP